MKVENYMMYDGTPSFVLKADEGKVLVRKEDGVIFGEEVYLGYTYYLDGERVDAPVFEKPEDYEEVDKPKDEFPEYEEVEPLNNQTSEQI